MSSDLEKEHNVLITAATRYSSKTSPLLILCGSIQEGLNLQQALVAHCQKLKEKIDELEQNKNSDSTGEPVQREAQRPGT